MQPVALTCLYTGALLLGAGTIGYWAWPSKHATDPRATPQGRHSSAGAGSGTSPLPTSSRQDQEHDHHHKQQHSAPPRWKHH